MAQLLHASAAAARYSPLPVGGPVAKLRLDRDAVVRHDAAMPRVSANGIEIEYEEEGDPQGRPLLLVNGLGGQLVAWAPEMRDAFAERGFRVIRHDNRDAGLSTWFDNAGAPDVAGGWAGPEPPPPPTYGLEEMADDIAGLLDALGIEAAHLFGISMGGMIVQSFAIRHPQRLLSLCSVMSTTGEPGVGPPTPEALAVLLRIPAPDRESRIAQSVEGFRVIGSTAYPFDEERERARAEVAYDRAYHPAGVARQLYAIISAADRTAALGEVKVPTLVIHGEVDPLIGVAGGRATAAAIPGSKLLVFEGMGHDLPIALVPEMVDAVVANADLAGDAAGAAA
jgi:pimeloyl-ACP methyl ester carboxylesterase